MNIAVCFLAWSMGALAVWGAESVFSADASRVYLVPLGEGGFVNELHLQSRLIDQHSLTAWVGKQHVVGLSRNASGDILVCTENAVWKWKPAAGKAEKLCEPAPGETFADIAYDLKSRWTLLTTVRQKPRANDFSRGLSLRRDDSTNLAPVFVRRVEYLEGPVFDGRGILYFGSRGDLWQGQIQWDGESDAGRGLLHAYRFCPLATLETSMSTPAETGARCVAVAGDRLYVHVKRIGGSGWGDIVRLKAPPAALAENGELDLVNDLTARSALYQQSLAAIEHLSQDGGWSHLCASADGKVVHYTTGSEKGRLHWLVRDHGEPVQQTGIKGSLK